MTHWHITSWVVALILVFVSYGLYGSGKAKGAKITHMILRLFYIIIILTGAELFVRFANWNGEYAGKCRWHHYHRTDGNARHPQEKGKSTGGLWIGFIIVLVLTVPPAFTCRSVFTYFNQSLENPDASGFLVAHTFCATVPLNEKYRDRGC